MISTLNDVPAGKLEGIASSDAFHNTQFGLVHIKDQLGIVVLVFTGVTKTISVAAAPA